MTGIYSVPFSQYSLEDISLSAGKVALSFGVYSMIGILNAVKLDAPRPFLGVVVTGTAYLVNEIVSLVFEKFGIDLQEGDDPGPRNFSNLTICSAVHVAKNILVGVTTVTVSVVAAKVLGYELAISLASRILLESCIDIFLIFHTFGEQISSGLNPQEDLRQERSFPGQSPSFQNSQVARVRNPRYLVPPLLISPMGVASSLLFPQAPRNNERPWIFSGDQENRNGVFNFFAQSNSETVLPRRASWQDHTTELFTERPPNPSELCSVCLNPLENLVVSLECNHEFHRGCISNWFDSRVNCPCCRRVPSAY